MAETDEPNTSSFFEYPAQNALLLDEEQQFRLIFKHFGIGVAIHDANGGIVECNQALQDILGYTRDDLLGKRLIDFSSPDDREIELRLLSEMNAGSRTSYQLEQRYRRKDSQLVWGRLTVEMVKDEQGQLVFMTCMLDDVTERKKTEEEVHKLLYIDDLTGLYNRRGFFVLVEQQVRLAARQRHELMLLYADIDNLKRINDTFGHKYGDLALVDFANILREVFRTSDIIARIGEDEFVTLAIEAKSESIEIIRARLENALAKRNAQPMQRFQLSASCGIIPFDYESGNTIQDVIMHADLEMYEEKSQKHLADKPGHPPHSPRE